jgi:hypothetical protein
MILGYAAHPRTVEDLYRLRLRQQREYRNGLTFLEIRGSGTNIALPISWVWLLAA